MSVILKVELDGEIRRVGFDPNKASLAEIETKLRLMFPQLMGKHVAIHYRDEQNLLQLWVDDKDVSSVFEKVKNNMPPLLRLFVTYSDTAPSSPAKQPEVAEPKVEEEIPAEVVDTQTALHALTCQSCKANIYGVHFKCLNCLHFELCEECELKGVHNPMHLLVKMRVPYASLPPKRQLVFKNHIEDPKERAIAKEEKAIIMRLKEEEALQKRRQRENEKKKRAQEKLKRMLKAKAEKKALKQKVAEKRKLAISKKSAEKKKDIALSKVKKAKRVLSEESEFKAPVQEIELEEIKPSTVEMPSEKVDESFIDLSQEPSPQEKEDFSLFKLMSEFQLLKDVKIPFISEEPASPGETSEQLPQPEEVKREEPIAPQEEEQTPQPKQEEQPKEQATEELQQEEVEGEAEPEAKTEQKEPTAFERNLCVLEEMGFSDRARNIELLVQNVGDLDATIEQLLRPHSTTGWTKWLPFGFSA